MPQHLEDYVVLVSPSLSIYIYLDKQCIEHE